MLQKRKVNRKRQFESKPICFEPKGEYSRKASEPTITNVVQMWKLAAPAMDFALSYAKSNKPLNLLYIKPGRGMA